MTDIPLDSLIDAHNLNGGSATILLKELDLSQKAKGPPLKGEVESYDIFGLTSWRDNDR